MPQILVYVPRDSFPGDARAGLVRRITDAAAKAEQIPDNPRKRMLCWVLIEETDTGAWTCGGADVTERVLPCFAMVHLPAGVLDDGSRATCVQAMHDAFQQSRPAGDPRQLVTSIVLNEVADGTWGANGTIWHLPQFAQAAGFAHLQHLAAA
ncbi:tautomerase [Paracidovorax anthurii]|uniref:Phenylpyruvate tautomerase PptA (4-oxalocrotonate tautomerase family) n=1 Tax=Paracidovorax anthurii TaxID=78229 RepID=A0A328YLM1_9BURK|nr:tautomerase [Paracidovorax anthurii]RAR73993.1 phenylpyruvate tautomerase PptA (4-oxalocrotonate tautomerase family) [Paracidovorax anthurii]